MPDPVWSASYNFSQTPEQNSFTRILTGSPIVTTTTTGPTANRKVTVDSTNGDAVFLTSNVPSFNSVTGATGEMSVAVTGAGDAGMEITFLDLAFGLNILTNSIIVDLAADPPNQPQELIINTSSNTTPTVFRVTIDSSKQLRIYRTGTLISGPTQLFTAVKPFQRFLWWGESGGIQNFNILRYFIGGAVVPG